MKKGIEKQQPARRWPYSLAESRVISEKGVKRDKRVSVANVPAKQPRDPSAHRAEVLEG